MAGSNAHPSQDAFSLIEVMVATLILTIVFLSAAPFFASPPALFEARQQAAISEAAGILQQLFMYPSNSVHNGLWLTYTATGFATVTSGTRSPLPETESFDYQLHVTNGPGVLASHLLAHLALFRKDGTTTNEVLQLLLPPDSP